MKAHEEGLIVKQSIIHAAEICRSGDYACMDISEVRFKNQIYLDFRASGIIFFRYAIGGDVFFPFWLLFDKLKTILEGTFARWIYELIGYQVSHMVRWM